MDTGKPLLPDCLHESGDAHESGHDGSYEEKNLVFVEMENAFLM
jgi:hypothetical protein